jgi:hypothetical protein
MLNLRSIIKFAFEYPNIIKQKLSYEKNFSFCAVGFDCSKPLQSEYRCKLPGWKDYVQN